MPNPITVPTDDAIWITGDLYCKTPEALEIALEQLRGIGYTIEDLRQGSDFIRGGLTPEQMEAAPRALWYASLKDIRKGKCNSCNSLIDTRGIQSHGHVCEVCNEVTYLKIIDGSTVRFFFQGEEWNMFGPELNMEAKRWDAENGWLYLKQEFRGHGLGTLTGEQAEEYLARHCDKWELVEEDGEKLVKVHYANDIFVHEDDVISVMDIWGHHWNHKMVKVWNGVEYSEYDRDFPLPESIHLLEAWRWAPLEPTSKIHELIIGIGGQISRADYYYQDGRVAWSPSNYERMGKFIRHFTTLDADAWDQLPPNFRLDGPGGIADVAAFCHPDAVVENNPNIGNFLTAVTGTDRSLDNLTLAARAVVEDDTTREFATGLFSRRREK